MDHAHQPSEANGLPVQGPHLRLRSSDELPADFLPLRLVLQPSGTVVEVDRPDMLVGRHTDADIRLPLPDVSRRHCRLRFVESSWQVVDLDSLNGVQVNGQPVAQSSLEQGDLLRIGGFTFAVEMTGRTGISGANSHVQSILKSLTTTPKRQAS